MPGDDPLETIVSITLTFPAAITAHELMEKVAPTLIKAGSADALSTNISIHEYDPNDIEPVT